MQENLVASCGRLLSYPPCPDQAITLPNATRSQHRNLHRSQAVLVSFQSNDVMIADNTILKADNNDEQHCNEEPMGL